MIATKHLVGIMVAAATFFIGHYAYAGVEYLLFDRYSYLDDKCHSELIQPAESIPKIEPRIGFEDGDIAGDYHLFDETLGRGFPDVNGIEITTADENGSPIPISGVVHGKREHKFTSVTFTRDRFTFETEAIRGVSYRLIGKIDLAHPQEEGSGSVIRGKFTRLEKGKIVGSMYASFYPGGC